MQVLCALSLLVCILLASVSGVSGGVKMTKEDVKRGQDEEQFQKWLNNDFQAAKPQFQKFCMKQINGFTNTRKGVGSQFGQDMWMFFNVFKYWPMQNRKGYYVDRYDIPIYVYPNTLIH
jgi:hypothetical protein